MNRVNIARPYQGQSLPPLRGYWDRQTHAVGSNNTATIPYNELPPSAAGCEGVLQFAGSLGAVAQWLELGTHNP
jgi:hypothetical protein